MKEIVALIWGFGWAAVAICLHIRHGLHTNSFIALLVFSVVGGLAISNYDIIKKWKGLGVEIETVRENIENIKTSAISDIRKEVNRQKESIALLTQNANEANEKLKKTIEMASPPVLSLLNKSIKKTDSGYEATFTFKPSTSQPIGSIGFIVILPQSSPVKIIDFSPKGPVLTSQDSKKISDDAKEATVIYGLLGGNFPSLELKLSGPETVQIAGSHIPESEPIVVDIK
jgi:hypothetical protein